MFLLSICLSAIKITLEGVDKFWWISAEDYTMQCMASISWLDVGSDADYDADTGTFTGIKLPHMGTSSWIVSKASYAPLAEVCRLQVFPF